MRILKLGTWIAVAVTFAALHTGSVSALAVPPTPTDTPVVDQTNTLTDQQKQTLAQAIAAERSSTGNQIAILMIPSLEGDSLEEYSLKVARTWGVGQKERNSGVLLLIAKNDHKLRIEVGYGLEGALPDIRAGQIIRDRITPQFREGKFYEGISSGLTGITLAIHSEVDPTLSSGGSTSSSKNWGEIFQFVIFGVLFIPAWIGSILARSKSWWGGGVVGIAIGVVVGLLAGFLFTGIIVIVVLMLLGLLLDFFVSKNYKQAVGSGSSPSWWAGGGFGGGSSGGGGGFGGGSFGGGGSSGSW